LEKRFIRAKSEYTGHMTVPRLLGAIVLGLAFAAPQAVAAQTATPATSSDALAAQTKSYFTAILHANATVLSAEASPVFHVIQTDGTRLDFAAFIRDITNDFITAEPPMGVDENVTASNVTDDHATETVKTLTWWYGALGDPMSGPVPARDYATHQLTWSKSATGTWLLDEDRITAVRAG